MIIFVMITKFLEKFEVCSRILWFFSSKKKKKVDLWDLVLKSNGPWGWMMDYKTVGPFDLWEEEGEKHFEEMLEFWRRLLLKSFREDLLGRAFHLPQA